MVARCRSPKNHERPLPGSPVQPVACQLADLPIVSGRDPAARKANTSEAAEPRRATVVRPSADWVDLIGKALDLPQRDHLLKVALPELLGRRRVAGLELPGPESDRPADVIDTPPPACSVPTRISLVSP